MQVFVQLGGSPPSKAINDVEPTGTVADLKDRIRAKLELSGDADLRLVVGGRQLADDGATLAECGIRAGTNISVFPRTPAPRYDPEVERLLRELLTELAAQLNHATVAPSWHGTATWAGVSALGGVAAVVARRFSYGRTSFALGVAAAAAAAVAAASAFSQGAVIAPLIFIGLGSYDNGHGEETIRRQQCPSRLFEVCARRRMRLTVILVDPGFNVPLSSRPPQIYDIDSNWQFTREYAGGKVRHFKYSGLDYDLWTFATHILPEEYAGAASPEQYGQVAQTLAGLHVPRLFLIAIGKSGGCVIVGNFYNAHSEPYYLIGDAATIEALGYAAATHSTKYITG